MTKASQSKPVGTVQAIEDATRRAREAQADLARERQGLRDDIARMQALTDGLKRGEKAVSDAINATAEEVAHELIKAEVALQIKAFTAATERAIEVKSQEVCAFFSGLQDFLTERLLSGKAVNLAALEIKYGKQSVPLIGRDAMPTRPMKTESDV